MDTGLINQRIDIYSNNPIKLAAGGTDPNNELYWSTNAEVKQLRSARTPEANQTPIKQVFQFKVRYRRDKQIQNNMLLYWRGMWMVIQSYVPDVVYNEYVIFDAQASNMGNIVTT